MSAPSPRRQGTCQVPIRKGLGTCAPTRAHNVLQVCLCVCVCMCVLHSDKDVLESTDLCLCATCLYVCLVCVCACVSVCVCLCIHSDKGVLERTEPVPFRLTRNLSTFFTAFGVEGMFLTAIVNGAQVWGYDTHTHTHTHRIPRGRPGSHAGRTHALCSCAGCVGSPGTDVRMCVCVYT